MYLKGMFDLPESIKTIDVYINSIENYSLDNPQTYILRNLSKYEIHKTGPYKVKLLITTHNDILSISDLISSHKYQDLSSFYIISLNSI
jgi:hypothetical protein